MGHGRYPIGALAPRISFAPIDALGDEHDGILAARLGTSRRRVHDWRTNGLPESRADEIAVRLGYHPCELWPDDWFAENTTTPAGRRGP